MVIVDEEDDVGVGGEGDNAASLLGRTLDDDEEEEDDEMPLDG